MYGDYNYYAAVLKIYHSNGNDSINHVSPINEIDKYRKERTQ